MCGNSLVDGEETMCLTCRLNLPRTNFHSDPFNEIHQRLATPGLPIDKAAAWFHYYRDNPYARMLQAAKYNQSPQIARHLGRDFAKELGMDFFSGIDLLMPVPLHITKFLRRGYNQAEEIALGVSSVTGIPIADNLRMRRHSTQTRKSATQRAANASNIAYVTHPEELANIHILVIDDIITTGSTMLSCLRALKTAEPSAKLSVLTLAATHMV